MRTTTIEDIPGDVLRLMFLEMPPNTVRQISVTTKKFRRTIANSHAGFWRSYAAKHPVGSIELSDKLWFTNTYVCTRNYMQLDFHFIFTLIFDNQGAFGSLVIRKDDNHFQEFMDKLYQEIIFFTQYCKYIRIPGHDMYFWALLCNQTDTIKRIEEKKAKYRHLDLNKDRLLFPEMVFLVDILWWHGSDRIIDILINLNACELQSARIKLYYRAAMLNKADLMQQLVDNYSDYDEPAIFDNTPLMQSCQFGSQDCVSVLLARGVDVSWASENGCDAIFLAVRRGNLFIIKSLVTHGAAIKKRYSETGMTLLHVAADQGHHTVVEYLIEDMGLNIHVKDSIGRTSLAYAVHSGCIKTVNVILSKFEDTHAEAKQIIRCCIYAVSFDDPEILKSLLATGVIITEEVYDHMKQLASPQVMALINDHTSHKVTTPTLRS